MIRARSSSRTLVFALLAFVGCAHGNDSDGFGGGYQQATGGASGTSNSGSSSSSSSSGLSATQATTASSTSASLSTGTIAPGTLFFSEYVEGSSNNKAVEIVNAGPTPVDLSGCFVDRYQNGAATAADPALALDAASVAPGGTFVVCNNGFSQGQLCNQLSDLIQHSGDDVVALRCADGNRDIIGRVGEAAVWGVAPTRTQDATLRRKCTVVIGDTNGGDAFDPAVEWDGFTADAFADLGQRNCP